MLKNTTDLKLLVAVIYRSKIVTIWNKNKFPAQLSGEFLHCTTTSDFGLFHISAKEQ